MFISTYEGEETISETVRIENRKKLTSSNIPFIIIRITASPRWQKYNTLNVSSPYRRVYEENILSVY